MNPMNWPVVFPELVLLAMACAITLVDLWVTDSRRRLTFWLTQGTLLLVGLMHLGRFFDGATLYGMQAMMVADPMGQLFGLASLSDALQIVLGN